jgi:nucleotide-binding universal stress UspA family protein
MFRHVLIPTDGSALSNAAVEKGLVFAREAGATAVVMTVVEPFHVLSADSDQLAQTRSDYERHAREQADRILAEAKRRADTLGVVCETVRADSDHPHEAIIGTATRRGSDLIVMASHGRRGMSALVLGSVTVKVLTHSTIPVLVYR